MAKKLILTVLVFVICMIGAELFFQAYLPLPLEVSMAEEQNQRGKCFDTSFEAGYTPLGNHCGRDANGLLRNSENKTSGILILGDSLSDRNGWAY